MGGKVVARFYVSGVTKRPDGTAQVDLQPVGSKENARWSQYTPSGSISMNLTRKASGARRVFEGVVDAASVGGPRAECLVTFDFDVEKGEVPEYRHQAQDGSIPADQLGYVSDEV